MGDASGGDGRHEPDRLPALRDALRLAARRGGTPAYVTDVATLDAAAAAVTAAFPDPWERRYSLKANHLPAIVAHLHAAGFRGERRLPRRVGDGDPRRPPRTRRSRSRGSGRPTPTFGRRRARQRTVRRSRG